MMRTPAAILTTLLVTACATLPAPVQPTAPAPSDEICASNADAPTISDAPLKLTVATYNVLGGPPPQDWFPLSDPADLDPMAREPATVALIKQLDADVVGLQEYRPEFESGRKMATDLDQYTWVLGEPATVESVAVPILYRSSRFDCLATGNEKVSSVGEDGSMLDRHVNWVELLDRDSGRRFYVFNYHAHPWQTPELAAVRATAIDRLLDLVRRVNPGLAEPFAITGDFNSRSDETRPAYASHLRKLGAAGIVDSAGLAAKDTSNVPQADSLNKMSAKVAGKDVAKVVRRNGRHIDYVWVPEGTKVATWATVTGPDMTWRKIRGTKVAVWTGIVPSDHSPVVADLRFGKPT